MMMMMIMIIIILLFNDAVEVSYYTCSVDIKNRE